MRASLLHPALVGYLAYALGTSWLESQPWAITVTNYLVVVPLYVLAIRWWTRADRPLEAAADIVPRSRRTELVGLGVIVLLVVAASCWYAWHPAAMASAPGESPATPLDGWAALAGRARNAGAALLIFAVPIGITMFVLRLRPREAGLVPRYLGLGLALVASGIAFGLARFLAGGPAVLPIVTLPAFALPLYAIQIFVNGLPEELLFRGIVLQRVFALGRSPTTAIVVSSVLFSAMHIPIRLAFRGDTPIWEVVVTNMTSYTGLVWGYLMYRTRSIWPGVLWHTSYTVLGTLFV